MNIIHSDYEIKEIIKPTDSLVYAYKNVFNNSAWKEGVKCSDGCGFKTTFEEAPNNCPECNGSIEDFYSNKEVKGFIDDVLQKDYNKALQAIKEQNNNVGGFVWGWGDELNRINKNKLGLKEEEYKKLQESLYKKGIDPDVNQFYLSEIGVTTEGRGKGLGTKLFSSIQEEVGNKMNSILRTSKNSPMYGMGEKLGYEQIFDYKDKDGRVIMASKNIS